MARGRMGELCVGAVVPRTGRLARLGDPLLYALGRLAPRLAGGVRGRPVRLAWRDSRSGPDGARRAVAELVRDEGASAVVVMGGTRVLPAVADACEVLGIPCLSTGFPWQAYALGRGAEPGRAFRWTFHFGWGLDDIAAVFAEMWERVGPRRTVGCLWNDGPQGRALRHPRHGFAPVVAARGHTLVDPGGYREPATGFAGIVRRFKEAGTDVVTGAATVADLALFHRQAREAGLRTRLITCSRQLDCPRTSAVPDGLANARIATLVYWTPRHPYRSSLDDTTAARLAQEYRITTGRPWLQPLGLAHALLEVAVHALTTAADPTDRHAVAAALGTTRLATVAGPLDFTAGPVRNVALLPLIGGQWRPGRGGARELALVTNARLPHIRRDAELTVGL
ncbi:ABC transporter substrate-binding protein [Streptomyces hesseae]|uniref:ABC transporter substrate-binding protein n=1 Tax=Streptomyces hesseae TaxID=3075519 RepID=A0ABU2SGG2_9ACTN|nr:ABC transporter substrate-binding protein [Streptomyces sp. DSM 40473]MDT0447967.1 ABC transporter substrate-binding protein [Streptomyces sp. DSM 40473]